MPLRFLLRKLVHAGVTEDESDGPRFCLVENSDKFRRSVSQIDKSAEYNPPTLQKLSSLLTIAFIHRRELQKIGVIYVKHGQEDQNTILRNDKASRSPMFTEFIHALGWTVPLANHLGYTGGLDRMNCTTGNLFPSSCAHAYAHFNIIL